MRDALYYAQLALESVVGVFGIRLYEQPRYVLEARLGGGVEVRRYGPRLAAEVEMAAATPKEESERAFRALFEYIAGANGGGAGGEKIAMTTPVEVSREPEKIAMTTPVETARSGSVTRMRFFLPARLTRETAPAPRDPRVRIVEIPPDLLAIRRFSGTAPDDEIARQREALLRTLAGSDWRPAGRPVTLVYDAPFTLPFVRRNEVAVSVARAPAAATSAPGSTGATTTTR